MIPDLIPDLIPDVMSDLVVLARNLLGPDVAVVGGNIADLQHALWPEEAALVTRAGPARRADFTAGRVAVRQALAALGSPPRPILQGAGGEPIWPDGITGSLTHGGGLCLAALGRTGQLRAIGVDLEPLAPLEPELGATICTVSEQRWIATQSDAVDLPLRIFTAKEAAYKALYPHTGVVFDFEALTILPNVGRDGFTVHLTRPLGEYKAGATFQGKQGIAQNACLSILTLPATSL